uniref:PAS domain S-box protein n=1 Tax=Oculatella sp. LEGE 06141 TaxID=1828648 RepID=UPI0030DA7F12
MPPTSQFSLNATIHSGRTWAIALQPRERFSPHVGNPSFMRDEDKPKAQLIEELVALRQRVAELEASSQCCRTEEGQHWSSAELHRLVNERTLALQSSNEQFITEVAKRQQSESALRSTKDQLKAILEAVPGIVSWISSDLRYLGVNRHLADTFGLAPEAFVGQDIGFLQTSSDFSEFVREFFASSAQDGCREVTTQLNGEVHKYLIVAQKYDRDRAAFVIGINITERYRAEEKLRQAEAKYRSIYENAIEGIFQTTLDGCYLSANPALARIYGYDTPNDLITQLTQIEKLYVDPHRRQTFVQQLHHHDAVFGFESQIVRKDGSQTWISENARAVRDEHGTLLYYEGTVEDIAERKQAEAALQQANEALETRVEERTAALQALNQQLMVEISERQRVEAALRASEAELKALFAAMTDAIAVFDREGRYLKIVSTNSQCLHHLEAESVGQTIHDVLPIAQADLVLNHIRLALETQQTVSLEYNVPLAHSGEAETSCSTHTQPTEAWFVANVSPMPENRVIWVARDITQRKYAEEALRHAEAKYRSIFENAAEGIFQTTPDGRCLSVNPAIARMYGYSSPEAFITEIQDIGQLYVAADRRAEFMAALTQTGAVANFESQAYRNDGSIIWVSENARVVHDANGNLLYYEGTIEDITKRKQAEAALYESQRTLSTLMSNLPGMAYRCLNDSCWTMQFVSEGCYDLTGYSSNALIENSTVAYADLIHPDDRKLVWGCVQAAIESDRPFQMVYRILTVTGDQKWVWEQGRSIHTAGEVTVLEGFISDITERKRAELALQAEQQESERLLLNILPAAIAKQLKQTPQSIAQRFEEATILFADIVDFTTFSAQISPTELVGLLNEIFSTFDYLAEWHHLEKIKTVGDAYMVVGGVPTPREDHLEAIAEMALDMQQAISCFQREGGKPFTLRIGINTGPVVAGVIGVKKFIYDLWGDTVNVASRMEVQGISGGIQVTDATYSRLKDKYEFEPRGAIFVKGRGEMTTYWLKGRKEGDRFYKPALLNTVEAVPVEAIPFTPVA